MSNMLIVHGGAPTAVINASLYGALNTALQSDCVDKVYGAVYGTGGILSENFVELGSVSEKGLSRLCQTPASAIGTSRTPLEDEDYADIVEILRKHDIKYLLMTGGNGTMDTCGKIAKYCKTGGFEINVVGIPKTIDNDISVIDHAPGYASAANFIAHAVREIAMDVNALPIHVCIIETMGRNAGWITAAAALAKNGICPGPDLIYLPERPFSENQFLQDVKKVYDEKGCAVVVVSEGLKRADGETVAPPLFVSGRARYDGAVGAYLSKLVISELHIKARDEKPGLWGRSCSFLQSSIDREEAVAMGALAARSALSGKTCVMAGLKRLPGKEYKTEEFLIPIEKVMLDERLIPDEFINAAGNGVTEQFVEWCRPFVDEYDNEFIDFKSPAQKQTIT